MWNVVQKGRALDLQCRQWFFEWSLECRRRLTLLAAADARTRAVQGVRTRWRSERRSSESRKAFPSVQRKSSLSPSAAAALWRVATSQTNLASCVIASTGAHTTGKTTFSPAVWNKSTCWRWDSLLDENKQTTALRQLTQTDDASIMSAGGVTTELESNSLRVRHPTCYRFSFLTLFQAICFLATKRKFCHRKRIDYKHEG